MSDRDRLLGHNAPLTDPCLAPNMEFVRLNSPSWNFRTNMYQEELGLVIPDRDPSEGL